MSQKLYVDNLLKENNGIMTSGEAREAGVSYKTIQRMHQSGEIKKLDQGLYFDPKQTEDEFFLTQYKCKRGIFSHETALYFHNLSDLIPQQLMLTIPSGYNTRLLKQKEKYKFFYIAERLQSIGKVTIESPFGHEIHIYDKERTVCDCIKKKNLLDADVVNDALRRYMKLSGADFSKLLEYAEIFKIEDLVRKYMEVHNG